jgi:hypothetical protein
LLIASDWDDRGRCAQPVEAGALPEAAKPCGVLDPRFGGDQIAPKFWSGARGESGLHRFRACANSILAVDLDREGFDIVLGAHPRGHLLPLADTGPLVVGFDSELAFCCAEIPCWVDLEFPDRTRRGPKSGFAIKFRGY